MKKRMKSTKAQNVLGMPFSVIFSIILIVFFIVIAFIVIRAFLDSKNCAQEGIFIDNLKEDVKKAWNEAKNEFTFKADLPTGIDYVCFVDFESNLKGPHSNDDVAWNIGVYTDSGSNLVFYPREKGCNMPHHFIDHLDIEAITTVENPYCISVVDGKINIRIIKEYNDRLVRLRRA